MSPTPTAVLTVSDPIDSFPFGLIAKKAPTKAHDETYTHARFYEGLFSIFWLFLFYDETGTRPFNASGVVFARVLHINKLKRQLTSSSVPLFWIACGHEVMNPQSSP